MEKKQFLKLCDSIFTEYGFVKKRKSKYYWNGEDLQGEISVAKSSFSSEHFIDVFFYICDLKYQINIPDGLNVEFIRRLRVLNKSEEANLQYKTAFIDYELLTEDEFKDGLKADFDANVLPIIQHGKMAFLERDDFGEDGGYFIGLGNLHDKNIVISRLKKKECNYYFTDHPRG